MRRGVATASTMNSWNMCSIDRRAVSATRASGQSGKDRAMLNIARLRCRWLKRLKNAPTIPAVARFWSMSKQCRNPASARAARYWLNVTHAG